MRKYALTLLAAVLWCVPFASLWLAAWLGHLWHGDGTSAEWWVIPLIMTELAAFSGSFFVAGIVSGAT